MSEELPDVPGEAKPRARFRRRVTRVLLLVVVVTAVIQVVFAVRTWQALRHRTSEPTAFMAADLRRADDPGLSAELRLRIGHQAWEWVSLDSVSEEARLVLLSREDQEFPSRLLPFDLGQLFGRARAWVTGAAADPSGSTIPQQVAKNLFTDGSRNAMRKAVEADYAFHLMAQMSDREILETYLNSIEFGPGIWGVCAASWYYFDRAPATLTRLDMASLVGLMPEPKIRTIYPESPAVAFAREHVDQYIASLVAGNNREALAELTHTAAPAEESWGCRERPASLETYLAATTDAQGFPLYANDQFYWARITCQFAAGESISDPGVSRRELARRVARTPCD